MTDGWDLKQYKNNNVVLYNHNPDLPIGNATRIWKDTKNKQLLAKIKFHPEGTSPLSDMLFSLYDNDLLKATSPGYLVDYEKATFGKKDKDPRITFNGQELCEISLCTVPANAGALKQQSYIQNGLDLGIIKESMLEDESLNIYDEETYEQPEDKVEDKVTEPLVEDKVEDKVIEPEIDYTDKDAQEESLAETDDPYADFYKALDEINQEQIDSKDPDKLAGQIIESIQDEDPKDDSNDVFKSYIDELFAK